MSKYDEVPNNIDQLVLCRVKGEGAFRKFDGVDFDGGVVSVFRGCGIAESVDIKKLSLSAWKIQRNISSK